VKYMHIVHRERGSMSNNLKRVYEEILGLEVGKSYKLCHRSGKRVNEFVYFIKNGMLFNTKGNVDYPLAGQLIVDDFKLIPTITLTPNERAILSELKFEWIARDKDGDVDVYKNKPSKSFSCWDDYNECGSLTALNHLFQFIKWEDEEPYNVKQLLEG